jgi:hypothetical protein
VKKLSCVLVLCFITVFCACEKKKTVQKESKVLENFSRRDTKPVLMTGEQDSFHPQSTIESIRKKRLTDFGRLKKKPPVLTIDKAAAVKALNVPGFMSFIIDEFDQKPFVISSFPFDYENDIDALKRLYKQHNLNDIFSGENNELDVLMELMIYTYKFLDGGSTPTADTWWTLTGPSAETITKLRRENGIGGTSEHYAALFCQLSMSCGYNSRLISMHTVDENGDILSHNVCEVFLIEHNKWAVFDAYSRATYYLRDNIPQSALELRNTMFNNLLRKINPVTGLGDFTDVFKVREALIPCYRYIYVWRMNDILSNSKNGKSMPWQALYQPHLVWEDELAPINEGSFEKIKKFTNMDNPDYPLKGVKYVTHKSSDFYWNLNTIVLHVERPEDEKLRIYIDTITPNFDYFQISSATENKVYKTSDNVIEFNEIYNTITVNSYNKIGYFGKKVRMSIPHG